MSDSARQKEFGGRSHRSPQMRILFPFVGDSLGGSHISALQLIEQLRACGIRAIIGIHEKGRLSEFLDAKRMEWISLPKVRYPDSQGVLPQISRMACCALRLQEVLQEYGFQIVHTNDRRMHLAWLLAARVGRVAHVWHQRTFIKSRRIGVFARLASAVITISDYVCRSSPSAMRNRAYVIVNPVAATADPAMLREVRDRLSSEIQEWGKSKIVIWVGNWIDIKRPYLLPDIAADVACERDGRVVFLMIGRSSMEEREQLIARARQLGVDDRFVILDFQTPVEPWIANADLLLATAVREGLGRTLVEAMQLGTPVVASADGGHVDVVEHGVTGELVPADDPKAFASAIVRILDNDSERNAYSRQAQEVARTTYAPSVHAERVMAIYDSLV